MGKGLVALAFSGGLDTTFCALWLAEQGYEVATVAVDTGGFDAAERDRMAALAQRAGVVRHVHDDARQELFDHALRYLIFGNVLRGGLYPLSVSAERVCQAQRVAHWAKELGAVALAHGSTGAGNDQVRFDVGFAALAPDLQILTPIRDLGLSRAEETEYLAARGVVIPAKTTVYSVNAGLWGATVGGRETLGSWEPLPEDAYPSGRVAPAEELPPRELVVDFAAGVPCALDGEALAPVPLIERLNELGGRYGVGRGIHLGDTILGIKGRVGFEAPAAHLLVAAHRELEKLCLSGKQLFWKESLGNLYGALIHEGHAFDPLARDLEAFLESSQRSVSGRVRLLLERRSFTVLGMDSPHSMMRSDVAAYGEAARAWSSADAAGFTRIFGLQQRIARKAHGE